MTLYVLQFMHKNRTERLTLVSPTLLVYFIDKMHTEALLTAAVSFGCSSLSAKNCIESSESSENNLQIDSPTDVQKLRNK